MSAPRHDTDDALLGRLAAADAALAPASGEPLSAARLEALAARARRRTLLRGAIATAALATAFFLFFAPAADAEPGRADGADRAALLARLDAFVRRLDAARAAPLDPRDVLRARVAYDHVVIAGESAAASKAADGGAALRTRTSR